MKHIMIFSAFLALNLALVSCSDSPDVTYATDSQTIELSTTEISLPKEESTATVVVSASHEFTVYSSADWLTVSPSNSTGKTDTITITAEENTDTARTADVVVYSGGSRAYLSVTQAEGQQDIESPIDGYSLVWNDEFEGTELSSDWTYEIQDAGWVNNELQSYVNDGEVTTVSDGTLKINLRKDGDTYKSARIYAKKSTGWTYGYIEASIKLPKGKGTWPAFWMMPVNYTSWPDDGEIDIMEHVGYNEGYVVSTIHCNKYNNTGTSIESASKYVSTATSEFHVYGLEWTSSALTFYVDGEKLLTYENDGTGHDAWPFDAAFYPILNLAYGGSWGGLQGVDDSALPATMEVDYIRVFQ
ncbi:MAG: family 16 glycosylhydrolase [Prevotella sp.]|jgi:beta-glucanase (GH16 family)